MKTRMFLVVAALLMLASMSFGQGFAVAWIDLEHQLRASGPTACEGGDPLPDGWIVEIHQDVDADGPDADDPMPAVGDQPGNVNYNQFALNGVELGIGPGYFYTDPAWSSVGMPPPGPNNWYLVIRCSNGLVHYYTDNPDDANGNYHFTPNPTEVYTDNHWVCVPCVATCIPNPPVVTFLRDPVPWSVCAQLCPQQPTLLQVCPNPGETLDPTKPPIVSVWPGCFDHGCQQECPPSTAFIYNPDPLGWIYDPLTGCFSNVVIGTTEGCVCIVLEGFLAATIQSFNALPGDNEVALSWVTASETGVSSYSIMRDGAEIARVPSENSVTTHTYTYTDASAANGTTYSYGLNVVNNDNTVTTTSFEVTATPSFSNAIITEYALHQNFPNPFNPSTSLTFDVVEKNFVSLKVFNAAGQEVGTVANGEFEAGRHVVSFDAGNLPSGLYFYTVKVGNAFSATKKMLLVK